MAGILGEGGNVPVTRRLRGRLTRCASWAAYRTAYGAVLEAPDRAAADRAHPSVEKAYAEVDQDLSALSRLQETESLKLDEQITDDYHAARRITR
jgi:hypothetical protein